VFYAFISRLLLPLAWWGRLRMDGVEAVPERGPVLIVPNHDSQFDPVLLAVGLRRRRALRFLARGDLWKIFGLAPVMNGLRQIPIQRGAGDRNALDAAGQALRAGEAICIFPEGKLSLGERLRARSGAGHLHAMAPEAPVVLASITGTTEYVRFPRRPRVNIELFAPAAGQPRPDEAPAELAGRLLAELRERVPPVAAGRDGRGGRAGRKARARVAARA
jgi:1-acyl-sn-glycerol-3-phosphate acyltransferase